MKEKKDHTRRGSILIVIVILVCMAAVQAYASVARECSEYGPEEEWYFNYETGQGRIITYPIEECWGRVIFKGSEETCWSDTDMNIMRRKWDLIKTRGWVCRHWEMGYGLG